ncbi:MAG: AMP-binding protein, partial [Eubacterium sp.]|nr:AMP-binding protein [Eubacterium sp.]
MSVQLLEKIKENIKAYPDLKVIVDVGEGNHYTYRTFDLKARRIAQRLVGRGVKKGDFVLIVLPRNKEYVAAMYGIWLAGAAFVPQSPSYPRERVEFIRENCGARVVIDEQFLRRLEEEEPLTEDVEVDEKDPSILIYTSGSTGKPKGVLHTFGSINDSVIRFAMTQDVPIGFRA